jgi:hypothetical protein
VVGKPSAGHQPDGGAGDIGGKHVLRIFRRAAENRRQHQVSRQDEIDRDAGAQRRRGRRQWSGRMV